MCSCTSRTNWIYITCIICALRMRVITSRRRSPLLYSTFSPHPNTIFPSSLQYYILTIRVYLLYVHRNGLYPQQYRVPFAVKSVFLISKSVIHFAWYFTLFIVTTHTSMRQTTPPHFVIFVVNRNNRISSCGTIAHHHFL